MPVEAAAAGQPAIPSVGPIEQAAPWVEQCPKIAEEGRNHREPDPPDDPHQRRRDVAIGILIADKSGSYGEDEETGGDQLEQAGKNWMGEPPAEIDARITAGSGGMPGKERDDDKRQNNRGGRAEQIERQRQRQVVTLAKAMRCGRTGDDAAPRESGTARDTLLVPPAPEPCVLRDAPHRGAPQDEEHFLMTSKAHLILRRPRSGRLEGRMEPGPRPDRAEWRSHVIGIRSTEDRLR